MIKKSKYQSVLDWKKNDPQAHAAAWRFGLLPKICLMFGWEQPKTINRKHPNGYWTKERCIEEAKKYKTKNEWEENNAASVVAAGKNGSYPECVAHMTSIQKSRGYWTKERCIEEARKYSTRTEWGKTSGSSGSIIAARKNGWLDECVAHMDIKIRPSGYWTKENVLISALKYKTKTAWAKGSEASAYNVAKDNGWFEEATLHMDVKYQPASYWTKERCIEEARKYKTISEWIKKGKGGYGATIKNGWFKEATTHMISVQKPNGYWTKERCIEEARKYKTRGEWGRAKGSSYQIAKNNGWFDECIAHMISYVKLSGHWDNKQNCLAEANKYKTRSEWRKKGGGSGEAAKRNGWYEECTAHMTSIQRPPNYWKNKERCIEEAKKYNTISAWQKGNNSSCKSAYKNGWIEECKTYMRNN